MRPRPVHLRAPTARPLLSHDLSLFTPLLSHAAMLWRMSGGGSVPLPGPPLPFQTKGVTAKGLHHCWASAVSAAEGAFLNPHPLPHRSPTCQQPPPPAAPSHATCFPLTALCDGELARRNLSPHTHTVPVPLATCFASPWQHPLSAPSLGWLSSWKTMLPGAE